MGLPATDEIVSQHRILEGKTTNLRATVFALFEWAAGVASRFEELLEGYGFLAGGVFSALYFAWALSISRHKQLWFDEVVTYSVDHLPNWAGAWGALASGVDANPPLFHLVNRLLLSVLGDSATVQRASSILGFWLMSLGVYAIVRRRHSAAAGWVAALIPACSGAGYWATEARPYGMVLGLTSLAILCWLNSMEATSYRRWWLAGLTVSLAAAISSHYYSVFLIAPFLGAELTVALKRKRMNWDAIGAVLTSYLPLVLFYRAGQMTAANQYTGDTDRASLLSPEPFWGFVLGPVVGSIGMAVAIALGWNWLSRGGNENSRLARRAGYEVIIGGWFCLLPVVVVVAGRYVTHAYEIRYAITAVLGAAVLIGIGFDRLQSAIPGAAALGMMALLIPISADAVLRREQPRGRHIDYGWAQKARERPDLPVVYGMPLEFVQAWFNAPTPGLKDRIVGLVDVKEARQRTGSTTADLGVINLVPAMRVPAVGYYEFVARRKPFYLVNQPAILSWVTDKLVEDGAQLKLEGHFEGGDELYLVRWE